MKTELSDIDRAFLVFNARLDNLLRGMGAQMLPGGAYLLNTPAGPLRVAINGNWMIGYFASPLGGRLATKNGSDLHSGKWRYYCPQNVKALCDPRKVEDFAMKLDDVLAFKPTSGQRLLIEQDLRDRRRYINRMAEVFAAVPDSVTPQGCKPPLGTLISKDQEPFAKPVKATKPKATAKRTAAKDAKPKRRGRVAKWKVGLE